MREVASGGTHPSCKWAGRSDEPAPHGRWGTAVSGFFSGSRWAIILACAAIALAAAAAYRNSLSAPFVFDDDRYITNNRSIRQLWPIWPALAHGDNPETGRPLFNYSLALNYALGGTDVRGYHALNLALHILSGLLLFGVVRRTLLQPALCGRFGAAALPLALTVALLWTVHPLQTRAVNYVGQRAELFMGLFYLLMLYCFVRGVKSSASGVWHFLAVLACLLGMSSKEVMVSAPLAVLLYDRTFVAGSFRGAWKQRWRLYLCLAATWLPLGFLVAGKLRFGVTDDLGPNLTWSAYARTQVGAIVHYLRLSVWPHPLVFDYGPTVPLTSPVELTLCALILVLLAVGTGIALWRWPAVGFLGCCFFMILAPSSSVVPIAAELLGEHRMYLPLAPVLLLIVLVTHARFARWSRLVFPALIAAAVLLTVRRNEDYRSALAIWGDTVANRQDNPRAHNNLGNALLENGQTERAFAHFKKALAIQPAYALANANLGVALLRLGRGEDAIAHFRNLLAASPYSTEAHNGLGAALERAGRRDEATPHYRRALELDPGSVVAANNLGNSLLMLGETDQAIALFQGALAIQPAHAEAQNNLAIALSRKGRTDEAIALFERAVANQPASAEAHNNLAVALFQKGRTEASLAHFRQALKIRPEYADARNNLERFAWVLATSPEASMRNGARAVELAEELDLLPGERAPVRVATLAAAYAEAGRFAEAVAAAGRAMQLAAARNDTALANAIGAHLGLYRAGSPLRVADPLAASVVRP